MVRSILCFICLFVGTHTFGQLAKIKSLYGKGEYEKCLKVCEKQQFKDPMVLEAWLYDALIWTHYAVEGEGQLHAFKKARESLKILRQKDRAGQFRRANWGKYHEVVRPQLQKADEFTKQDDFSSAQKLYLGLINDLQDPRLYFYTGCSWVQNNDIKFGLEYMDKGLKNYYSNYQKYKIQPEPYFVEQILITAKDLISYKLYRVGWGCFKFLEEVYPNNPAAEIEKIYKQTIVDAVTNLEPEQVDVVLVLETYAAAQNSFPQDATLKGLSKTYVKSAVANASYHLDKSEVWANLVKGLEPVLDLKGEEEADVDFIQAQFHKSIYTNYEKSLSQSIKAYQSLKDLLGSELGEEELIQNFFDYGLEQMDIRTKSKSFLVYAASGKDYKADFPKVWEDFKISLTNYLEKAETNDESLNNILFFIKEFPASKSIRKALAACILDRARTLKALGQFSDADLLLYWGGEYWEDNQAFLDLELEVAKADYKEHYLASHFGSKELNWTGSVDDCDPGQISYQAERKVLERYNYIRRLAGLPDGNVLDTGSNRYCQAAALCMKAQGALSHAPEPDWKCYSKDATRGAGSNNLGLGSCCANSVDGMIEDDGTNNKATGHRRNLLNFRAKGFCYGATTSTVAMSSTGPYHDELRSSRYHRPYIAWPPEGAVPKELVFRRFSIRKMIGSYSIERVTSVKVYCKNKELDTNIEHNTASKIGWVVRDLPNFKEGEQSSIKVVLDLRVRESKAPKTVQKIIEYEIRVF